MARSILENPNFSWFTWNPTTWTDPVEDTTEDVVTSPGITSMYPYPPTGAGAGAGDITPINPIYSLPNDPNDPFFMQRDDDENWLAKQISYYRNKLPSWASPVGIMNALTGRKDATQSFAGGQGGVGSMGGLYQSEADLLNELMQAGFLVDTPGGVKTTSGKNVVSLLGGYEEGQEETYQAIIDRYGPNALNILTEKYGPNAAIVNRFKEAEFIVNKINEDKKQAVKNMATTPAIHRTDVHRDTPTTTTPTKTYQTVHDTGAVTQTGGGGGQTSISRGTTAAQASGMGGGSRQATSAGATRSGRTDSGWGWAKGGRVRYTNGGIVGLL